MKLNTKDFEAKMEKALSVLGSNFDTIRAGQANPAVLSRVSFEYYGSPTPITTMADIRLADEKIRFFYPKGLVWQKAKEPAKV